MNYKTCSKCKKELPATAEFFYREKRGKYGLRSYCKECRKKQYKSWQKNNPNYWKGYRENNREKILQNDRKASKKYKENNREKVLQSNKKASKKYHENNKSYYAAKEVERRSAKDQRTPPWLTKRQLDIIKCFYTVRDIKSKVDGIEYHVDHIIPLRGKNVSGLHVPWNLQLLTAEENWSKNNTI